jgi:hypothetical protein
LNPIEERRVKEYRKWLKPWKERVCNKSIGASKEGRKEKSKPERKKKHKTMSRGGRKTC